jgi:hypothetical protein
MASTEFPKLNKFASLLADAFIDAEGVDLPVVFLNATGEVHEFQHVIYNEQHGCLVVQLGYDGYGLDAYQDELAKAKE